MIKSLVIATSTISYSVSSGVLWPVIELKDEEFSKLLTLKDRFDFVKSIGAEFGICELISGDVPGTINSFGWEAGDYALTSGNITYCIEIVVEGDDYSAIAHIQTGLSPETQEEIRSWIDATSQIKFDLKDEDNPFLLQARYTGSR